MDEKSGLERLQAVDLIRGIDIVLMVMFNYSVTLSYFKLISMPSNFLYWFIFPRSIASIFIFLSGAAACISFEKNKDKFNSRYYIRGAKLSIFAISITFLTYIFVPSETIIFGILHFFAVSSFLMPFFIRYNRLNMVSGLLVIILGFYLQLNTFDFQYLFWLGFEPSSFSTFDYFPLIPWLGVLLLGIYSGKYIVKRTASIRFKSRLVSVFTFLGKNSLAVYLIHQPVLILPLLIAGFHF